VEDMARKKLIDRVNEKLAKEKGLQLDDLQMKANSEAIKEELEAETKSPTIDVQENIDEIVEAVTENEVQEPTVAVVDGATEMKLTDKEKEDLKGAETQTDNVQPAESNPDYLEYSAEAVGYANRTDQWGVYRTISNYIPEEDSVLDFGCGRGDFERFYQTEFRRDLDYIGIDMNKQLVDASKKAYNDEVDIRYSDWFSIDKDIKQDWSINICSNNLRYDADTKRENLQYMQDTLKSMMNHCNKGSIIMLSSDSSGVDDGLINWNAGDILNWAQKEFGNAAVDHSFSNDLFTLIIYKN
jgi:SAM-dependent methyltransferase